MSAPRRKGVGQGRSGVVATAGFVVIEPPFASGRLKDTSAAPYTEDDLKVMSRLLDGAAASGNPEELEDVTELTDDDFIKRVAR